MEVITLWGSVTRTGKANKLYLFVSLVAICLCSCVLFRRQNRAPDVIKKSRGGYEVLKEAAI